MEGIWLISYIVLWLFVIALGVLVLLLYRQLGIMYLGTAEGVSRDGLDKGTRAPDFNLTDQYDHPQQLISYRGQSVLLLFGSPHCSPCRILLPQLHEWARQHRDVNVVWLNSASPEESRRFVSETGATLPVAPYTPDDNRIIRAKGLVNSKGGLDMYYRELKTGKFEPPAEGEEGAENVIVQEVAPR